MNNFRGTASEHDGVAFLIRKGFVVSSPRPDMQSEDIWASRHFGNRSVLFRFQIKERKSGFPINRDHVTHWIKNIEQHPVLLLRVRALDSEHHQISFRVLHDWMQDRWTTEADQAGDVNFRLRDFARVGSDDNDGAFLRAIEHEAKRVIGKRGALFRTAHHVLAPVSEYDLYTRAGGLGRLEVTERVAKWASKGTDAQGACDTLRDSLEDASAAAGGAPRHVREWINSARQRPSRRDTLAEAAALESFVQGMRAVDRGHAPPLPRFTWHAVSTYRVACALYPESQRLLETMLSRALRVRDCHAVAASLHIIASIPYVDESREDWAIGLARKAYRDTQDVMVRDQGSYLIRRMACGAFGQATGDSGIVREVCDLVGTTTWSRQSEVQLNCSYYEGNLLTFRQALRRIAMQPKPRDLALAALNALQREIVGTALH